MRFVFGVMAKYEEKNPLTERCQIRSLVLPLNVQVQEDQSLSVVEKEPIEFLRELHFSWVKIAGLLGISKSRLYVEEDWNYV